MKLLDFFQNQVTHPEVWGWLLLGGLVALALRGLLRPAIHVQVSPPSPPEQQPQAKKSVVERISEASSAVQTIYGGVEKIWGVRWTVLYFLGFRFVAHGDQSRFPLYYKAALKLVGEESTREILEKDVFTTDEWGEDTVSHVELTGVIRSQWVRFEGGWVHIEHVPAQPADKDKGRSVATRETLTFFFLSRDREVVARFRRSAEELHQAQDEHLLTIYYPRWSSWCAAAQRRPRPTESLFFNGDLHLKLLEDYRRFQGRRADYVARGRLHKRGYLLCGAPGGGKTNVALWMAGQLKKNIAVLSTRSLDDEGFTNLMLNMPANTLLLLEDIDTVAPGHRSPNVVEDGEAKEGEEGGKGDEPEKGSLSLGTLLNTLDGLLSREGQLVVMTTNHPEKLDPALIRPGRADVVHHIESPNEETTRRMVRSWYGPEAEVEALVKALQALKPRPTAAEVEAHLDRNPDAAQAARDVGDIERARRHDDPTSQRASAA